MNCEIRRCTKKLQSWESRGCVGSAVGLPSLGGTKNQFCWVFMDSVMPGQPMLEHDLLSVSWKGRKTVGDLLEPKSGCCFISHLVAGIFS